MCLTIATLILAFFAAGSAAAAAWTAWETKRLRNDSQRPLLVPVGGKDGVARINERRKLGPGGDWLRVRNIGLGPAENIAIRLELRIKDKSPTVQLDEMLNEVRPLASGEEASCRQWQSAEKRVEIYDDHWVVISYDDLFHRHFETEARYIKEVNSWVSIRTEPVKSPRPRVREVDYYSATSRQNKNHK